MKNEKPKDKQYYTVITEALVPVSIKHRVLAEDPKQALEIALKSSLTEPPKLNYSKIKRIKSTIYKYGTLTIEFIKNY